MVALPSIRTRALTRSSPTAEAVIARSAATKQSSSSGAALDCFASLAMTARSPACRCAHARYARWRGAEVSANGLAPLAPVLNRIVHGTLAACDDFAHTLTRHFKWYEPTVPGMKLYMRGYHNETLKHALSDAESRIAEGRSLLGDVQHSPP
jgi:hypothetical protein